MKRLIVAAIGAAFLVVTTTACAGQDDYNEIKTSLISRHFTVLGGPGLGDNGKVIVQVGWGKCTGRVEYEDVVTTASGGGTLKAQIPVQGGFDTKEVEIANPADANALTTGAFAHCAPDAPAQK